MNNMPTDFATLAYPTINDFSSKFDNQLSQLKTSHVSNIKRLTFVSFTLTITLARWLIVFTRSQSIKIATV